MYQRPLAVASLLGVLVLGWPQTTAAEVGLDAETIRAGLRTADPDEEAYIQYVVTLRDQGRLPESLVDSSFQWARTKAPALKHKKFQYFKRAMIVRAARAGITLPEATPDLTPDINGQVLVRVLFLDIPVPGATVRIRGTKRETTTDATGRFSFRNVPLGTFTLDAQAVVLFIPRQGSAQVILPTTPPSLDPAFVRIELR